MYKVIITLIFLIVLTLTSGAQDTIPFKKYYHSLDVKGAIKFGNSAIADTCSVICSGDTLFYWNHEIGDYEAFGNISKWVQSGDTLYPTNLSSKVGIGTSAPNHSLEVVGDIKTIQTLGTDTLNFKTGDSIPFAAGTFLKGSASYVKDSAGGQIINSVFTGASVGGTGLSSFNGYTDSSFTTQAVVWTSSDGSLFGQSDASVRVVATDGVTYNNQLNLFPDRIRVGFSNEVTGEVTLADFNGDSISLELKEEDYRLVLDTSGLTLPIDSMFPPAKNGAIFFNDSLKAFYGYNGTAWIKLDN